MILIKKTVNYLDYFITFNLNTDNNFNIIEKLNMCCDFQYYLKEHDFVRLLSSRAYDEILLYASKHTEWQQYFDPISDDAILEMQWAGTQRSEDTIKFE